MTTMLIVKRPALKPSFEYKHTWARGKEFLHSNKGLFKLFKNYSRVSNV